VRLDAAEDAALDALAERQGVTRSEAVRRAIAGVAGHDAAHLKATEEG
jgi:predicted transcriptional regulator